MLSCSTKYCYLSTQFWTLNCLMQYMHENIYWVLKFSSHLVCSSSWLYPVPCGLYRGRSMPKVDELVPHPVKEQLPGVHFCVNSNPPWGIHTHSHTQQITLHKKMILHCCLELRNRPLQSLRFILCYNVGRTAVLYHVVPSELMCCTLQYIKHVVQHAKAMLSSL